jgi:peptide/nickel transport system substrate-binding protein
MGVSRTVLVGVAIVIIAIAGIGAYYLTRPSPTEVDQVLIVGTMEAPMNLDPVMGYYHSDIITNFLVFESLTEWIVPECLDVEAELATEWTLSDDGLTYDLTLRQGVKFHDGTEMTAEDVEFCIERAITLGADWSSIMGAVYFADIESVDVLDTYKVRLNLKRPNVMIPKILAFGIMASIYPKAAFEAAGDEWGKTVLIGSGPFKFVEYVEGERLVFERFDDYWGTKAKLDEIILLVDMDPTVGKMSLERGDIDVYYKEPLLTDIPALKANPDIEWQGYSSGRVRYLLFNLRPDVHEALQD